MHHKAILVSIVIILAAGAAILLGAVPSRAGATFTVDDTADALDANPGDGVCAAAGGVCTLRAAIMETNALAGADTIILPSGVYTLTIGGSGEDMATLGDLDITDDLTIAGPGAETTIIDGNGSVTVDRVVHIVGSNVQTVITGVTIRNGAGSDGTIQVNGDLTLSDSVITKNTNSSGIYVKHDGNSLTMTNCTVSNNRCLGIGVGYDSHAVVTGSTIHSNGCGGIRNGGVLMMVNSTVSGNSRADHGGGISNDDGTATLINCIVRDNTAGDSGGGIHNDGTMTIISNTICGNVALCDEADYGGGGIFTHGTLVIADSIVCSNTVAGGEPGGGIRTDGTLYLANTTISGNEADGPGGGIFSWSSSVYLNNVTLTGNTAGAGGGGVYWQPDTVGNVANSIIAGNTGSETDDCSGTLISHGYNLIQDTTGCFIGGDTTGNLTGVDPLLDLLKNNGGPTLTHALLPASPAINAGNPAGCTDHQGNPLLTDQRGMPRVGRCDMGAYEAMPRDPYRKTASLSAVLPGDRLTYTISLDNLETVDLTGVRVTDSMPTLVTYIENSLTATGGSYGYADGVVTWTGAVSAGGTAAIRYGVTVSETAPLGAFITNTAVISGGGEIVTRTASVFVGHRFYLPLVMRGGN